MDSASIPTKVDVVWASGAGPTYTRQVPDASQQPSQPYAASFTTGFPPDTFIAPEAGGAGPDGRDVNGVLQQLSAWIQWQAAGGPIVYDGTFQTAVGGYPQGAVVSSAAYLGVLWLSTADNNVTDPDSGGSGWARLFSPLQQHGQCRLSASSSTQLILQPYNGRGVVINGVGYQIPQAGITLANTGLTASTLYYIYLYNNVGTLTLEASTTGHSTDTSAVNYGVEIKTGDPTRTLIGMSYTGTGTPGTFVDSPVQRYIANWFNRRSLSLAGAQVAASTTSLSMVALGSGGNVSMVTWADEAINAGVIGYASNTMPGNGAAVSLGVDGSPNQGAGSQMTSAAANQTGALLDISCTPLSEGFHLLAPYGEAVTDGAATFLVAIQATLVG